MRVGGKSNKGMAAKVWEERQFQNLDDSLQLGTRNIKIALRKLRKMTVQAIGGNLIWMAPLNLLPKMLAILKLNICVKSSMT